MATAAAGDAVPLAEGTLVEGMVEATLELPSNNHVNAMLTDMYQITMTYAYWKAGRHNERAVFDLFFRKNPFQGEYTIFAGLGEVIKFVQTYGFKPDQIAFLRKHLPRCEPEFWDYLSALDCSEMKIYAIAEGTVVFPREPLIRVEGPLAVGQLLETTLLNLCNFASLVCTNAARHRQAEKNKTLLEFGLRRAQGPDGAMSATRYSFMGGFDGTSNVLGAMELGVRPMGTHAHALVSAFVSLDDLHTHLIDGKDVVELALRYRSELGYNMASLGELAAFISYAQAFPDEFLALVDTYDTLTSGVPNFICVALALRDIGYAGRGIRLDSGDLAYLSKAARRMFVEVDAKYGSELAKCRIVASNDINESVLHSLNEQGHEIDVFGIGTNLVTCQAQPALGMVYKLVEIDDVPRVKLSQEVAKMTLPGAKDVFRLVSATGVPLLDLLTRVGEAPPLPGKRILCQHPFDEKKRVYVTPSAVIPLLRLVWKGKRAEMNDVIVPASSVAVVASPAPAGMPRVDPSAAASSVAKHMPPTSSGPVALRTPTLKPQAVVMPVRSLRALSLTSGEAAGTPSETEEAAVSALTAIAGAGSPPVSAQSRFRLMKDVDLRAPATTLQELRTFVMSQLEMLREDHLRHLNPTPYKVSVTSELYTFCHELWMKEIPIPELE